MTEKTETQAKQSLHCACAPGDLSAIEPTVATTTAKTDGTEPSQPPAVVAPTASTSTRRGDERLRTRSIAGHPVIRRQERN